MAETGGTTGYISGSDLLLMISGKAVGHCTSHTVTMNSETKDRAVKPLSTAAIGSGMWKDKSVTGLSISISADGLMFYNETEGGFDALAPEWGKGKSVEVKAYKRGSDTNPYIQGKFVITSLEQKADAEDDATYSINLENDGEPTIYPGKVASE